MDKELELKRLHQGVRAIEMIDYHEGQYDGFVWNYQYEFQERPDLVKHHKRMAECELRCVSRLKKVYTAMGFNKNYGKH